MKRISPSNGRFGSSRIVHSPITQFEPLVFGFFNEDGEEILEWLENGCYFEYDLHFYDMMGFTRVTFHDTNGAMDFKLRWV